MEIKIEIGKGQFRWRLLVFVFFACAALVLPLAVYLNPEDFNFVEGIVAGLILAIPVNICVLIQKNWPIKIRVKTILYTILSFAMISQESLFARFLVLPGSGLLIVSYLFYHFVLKPFHRCYDEVEYVVVYIQRRLLLSTYISMSIDIFIISFIIFAIIINVPGQSSEIENYKRIASHIPLLPFIVSPLFAIPTQIFVCIQRGWSWCTKIINILVIEVVFIVVGVIATLFLQRIMCFIIFVGGALLRHIFLKSSEGRIDRGE